MKIFWFTLKNEDAWRITNKEFIVTSTPLAQAVADLFKDYVKFK